MISYIKSLPRKKIIGVASLVGSSIVNILAGVFISHFISKMIPPEDYGAYYYVINLIASACVFLSFGAFYTTSRLMLVASSDLSVRKLHGVSLKSVLFLSIFISVLLLSTYFIDTGLVDGQVRLLIWLAPFGVLVTLLNSYFEVVLPADNKLDLIAKSRLYPKILYGLVVVGVYYFNIDFIRGSFGLLLAYFLTSLSCYFLVLKDIHPIFRDSEKEHKKFLQEGRSYGFHVYLGSIFSVGGTALTGVAVGALGNSRADVVYYALATSLCAPLSILPAALSSANFSGFASSNCISRGLFIATLSMSITAAVVLCGISDYVVGILWGRAYFKVSEYVYLLTAAFALYALSDLINRFLAAKGNGRALRNSSFVVGLVLIASTLAMVGQYGGVGAAYARVVAGFAYLLCMLFFYKKQISAS